MIGSETFIIVAFMCREKRTPCSLASAICSARNASSARAAHDRGVDDLAREHRHGRLQHGGRAVARRRTRSAARRPRSSVTERSVERKSPSDIVETCDLESFDHSPIECGCAFANDFTDAGARRSELPSRRTGLTARALDAVVGLARGLLLVRLRVVRVVRDVVARVLELLDRRLQLRDRGADVRQLDDVRLGRLGQLAELGERVRDALLLASGDPGTGPGCAPRARCRAARCRRPPARRTPR